MMLLRVVCCVVLAIVIQNVHAQEGRAKSDSCNCAGFNCGITNRAGRVVGGTETGRMDYPWAVSLSYRSKLYCGATLVTDQHLVTAAHCISGINKSRVEIVLGSYNKSDTTERSRIVSKVGEWWPHPDFNRRTFNNDIGIIKLAKKIDFDQFVRPVCIAEFPKNNQRNENQFVGKHGIVTGWGRQGENGTPSDVLREVLVEIMSNQECKTKKYKPNEITENMMCAGYDEGKRDACQGDSGGPLLLENQTSSGAAQIDLIGVVSWGQGCARPGYPGVYTRLSKYMDFINKNIKNGCSCPRA